MSLANRSMGILMSGEGLIVRADPNASDRTDIEIAPNVKAGAIVRDSESGPWRYDKRLRGVFGIEGDPVFETCARAGREISKRSRPLGQIKAFLSRPAGAIQ